MQFTTHDNFDKEGYLRSISRVEKFCELFNNNYSGIKATPLDSKNRFMADVIIKYDDGREKYIEIENGMISDDVKIYERRLKKNYDKECIFIRHDIYTNNCIAIGLKKLKDFCLEKSEIIRQKRTTPNGTFDETIYIAPKTIFKEFVLNS